MVFHAGDRYVWVLDWPRGMRGVTYLNDTEANGKKFRQGFDVDNPNVSVFRACRPDLSSVH